MTEIDLSLATIAKRAKAIQAATKEVRQLHAKQQVSDALAIHNGLNTIATVDLPL
jgi:hypothetical protein